MAISRIRVALSNWDGGPGVTTWYVQDADQGGGGTLQAIVNAMGTLYTSCVNYYAQGVNVNIEPGVDILDEATGLLVDSATIVPPDTIVGAGASSPVSRATQMVVRLQTNGIVTTPGPPAGARRLQGRHFHGPIGPSAIAATGVINGPAADVFLAAYYAYMTAVPFSLVVWHRPTKERPGSGEAHSVAAFGVMPKPGVLRSRRD